MEKPSVWIAGYEGLYKICYDGSVYKVWKRFTKKRKPTVTRFGYLRVCLSKDGKVKSHHVHKLVAVAFIKNPEAKPCINHKDGNKQNNHVDNLEWCTYSENTKHMYDIRPTKRTGMTRQKARQIRLLYETQKYNQKQLSTIFGLSYPMVNGILNCYWWKD